MLMLLLICLLNFKLSLISFPQISCFILNFHLHKTEPGFVLIFPPFFQRIWKLYNSPIPGCKSLCPLVEIVALHMGLLSQSLCLLILFSTEFLCQFQPSRPFQFTFLIQRDAKKTARKHLLSWTVRHYRNEGTGWMSIYLYQAPAASLVQMQFLGLVFTLSSSFSVLQSSDN